MSNVDIVCNLTKPQLRTLLATHSSKNAILRELGIKSADPRARKALVDMIEYHGLTEHKLRGCGQYTDTDVRNAVAKHNSISLVLSELGLSEHGGNFATIRKIIKRLKLDTSHFNQVVARHETAGRTNWTVDNIFVENSGVGRGSLRAHVIKFNILPKYECTECGNRGEWNGKELKLNVDHINGINNDNRPENLRWICPNCHSQTETFGTQKRVTNK